LRIVLEVRYKRNGVDTHYALDEPDFTSTLDVPEGSYEWCELSQNVEIDMEALETNAVEKKEMRKNIMGYKLSNGRRVNVIAEGRLVNIAAGDGHPAEIMDLSFAVQALSAMYIRDNYKDLGCKVVDVSGQIDDLVARRKLAAWGIKIDKLTDEQEKYLNSWEV